MPFRHNYCPAALQDAPESITSTALDAEISQTPDSERLKNIKAILKIATIKVIGSEWIKNRSLELVSIRAKP